MEGGLSRRAGADRFAVAAATAVRCVKDWRATGAARAKAKGGDLRSRRIEVWGHVSRYGAFDLDMERRLDLDLLAAA